MAGRNARKVVLLGWDAADWGLFHPLLDAGRMPNLRRLIERGVMGNMATMSPPLSPLLWTTAATGVKPDRHGVLGFFEPDPVSGNVRPISSHSRKTKAIWNILHQAGMRSLVVNWYASHPAEPIHGAIVSDAYVKPAGADASPWPMHPGTVSPASLTETLAELRVHFSELTGEDLYPFVPKIEEVDQKSDSNLLTLSTVLAENITAHAAATYLMEREEWNFAAVFYPMIDHISHVFMQYHPPALPGVPPKQFELYKDVVNGACCFQDMLLGRIVQLAGEDAAIVVMSDHGLHCGHLRPVGPNVFQPETPAQLHRSHGVFCMAGPGIRHDELVFGAELTDVTPTILTLLGLPVGRDMQGRVLVEAFEEKPAIETIPSWEQVPGDAGRLQAETAADAVTAMESSLALKQLIDLGYIDPLTGDTTENVRNARNHHHFNLGRVYLADARAPEAVPLFEALVESKPEELAYRLYLAQAYFEAGRPRDCRTAVETAMQQQPEGPAARLILANVLLAEGDVEGGLRLLREAEASPRPARGIRLLVGRVYLGQKQFTDAERAFRSVLAQDGDHPQAHASLAEALLGQERWEEAADTALDAIRLQFDLPSAHLTLGVALLRLRRWEAAQRALETSTALKPAEPTAHQWLKIVRENARRNARSATGKRRKPSAVGA